MINELKRFPKRQMTTAVPYYLATNTWKGLRNRFHLNEDKGGSTHTGMTVEQSIDYIEDVYRRYCFFGELQPADIRGRRILEVGPGDNLGVALRFLIDGAREVVSLDRFHSYRDLNQQTEIYRTMQAKYSQVNADLFEAMIEIINRSQNETAEFEVTSFQNNQPTQRFSYIHGIGLENTAEVFPAASFDLIVSIAVMEHLYDAEAGMAAMDYLLAPGGMMLHEIDFRDHQMFSAGGQHPLAFLTLPDWVWQKMTSNAGGAPNRKLFNYYRERMAEMGYANQYHLTQVLGRSRVTESWRQEIKAGKDYDDEELELIAQIRPRLQPEFQSISNEDLLVSIAFIKGIKPKTND